MILTALIVLTAAAAAFLFGRQLAHAKAQAEIAAAKATAEQARLEAAEAKAKLESERTHAEEAMKKQAQALRTEFKAMTAEMLRTQGDSLRSEHLNALNALLTPLGRDIASFKTQFVSGHAAMDKYIKELVAQTSAIGREAEDLAKALRGNSKLQGNWGEAVLANLLEATGLERGRDYEVQVNTKTDDGRTLIPDVVVHLPGGRHLIIDSKVSLTAYTAFVAAEGDASAEERARLLKEHVKSVRAHIKELSEKRYDKLVPGAIGYVLMFVPGEAAYVAAVGAEPTLATEAYSRRVILINPGNLLMALQLAHNLWQSELQSRSVKEIYDSAERLYKKFANFAANYVKIGAALQQAQRAYDDAEKQLRTGRGNIVQQLEDWKKKGLTTSAEIPERLTSE